MKYIMTITPAIPVADRHKLQDALTALGYSVSGGGQMTDNSECDISFEAADAAQNVPSPADTAPAA